MKRKSLILVLVILLIGLVFTGCKKGEEPVKKDDDIVVTSNEKIFIKPGFKITLTKDFAEKAVNNADYSFETNDMAVLVIKDSFTNFDGTDIDAENLSAEGYVDLYIQVYGLTDSKTEIKEGLPTCVYSVPGDGITVSFLVVVYKSSDAFWLVQFASEQKDFDSFKPNFIKWAKTVVVE